MAVARPTRDADRYPERDIAATDPTLRDPLDPTVPAADPVMRAPHDGVAPTGAYGERVDTTGTGEYVRPVPPTRRDFGWRAILLGVAAFALIFLIAIFAGLFQLGDSETTAPPAPMAETPSTQNPLDSDTPADAAGPGAGAPTGATNPEPGAIDVPGTGGTGAPANQ